MVNATETTNGAVAPAATTSSGGGWVDGDVFMQQLRARMGDGADVDNMMRGMERLAAAFPDADITSHPFGDFASSTTYFITLESNTTLNVSPSLVADMADNDDAFERIRDLVSGLLEAGRRQNLVNVDGEVTQRTIMVDEEQTRYVEIQRDVNGRALSIASLLLETQQLITDTLEWLMNLRQSTGRYNTATSMADYFFASGNAAANARDFNSLVSSSSSWRFEGMITTTGMISAQNGAAQSLFATQRVSTRLEIVVEQWQTETDGTVDLFAYMQIMGLTDPLVFDLGDEGINLTSAEDGVYFDIRGDGTPTKTGWITGNNAFLFLDQNGNGIVDDANELFGDHGGFANGFEKLAQYDSNGDGIIDENDEIWSQLRLWRDLNGDGVCQEGEAITLAEAGITSINLNYNNDLQLDKHGNVIGEKSTFTRSDGSQGLVADAWFRNY